MWVAKDLCCVLRRKVKLLGDREASTACTVEASSTITLLWLIMHVYNVTNCILLLQEEAQMFGIDWEGPMSTEIGNPDRVTVQLTEVPLSDENFTELHELVDPLSQSSNHGIDLYMLFNIELYE